MFKSSDLNLIDFTEFNRIGIAYSGGVDSHVLLHSMLKEFGNSNLYALHINHDLTKDSDKWEKHCSLVCKDLKVAFKSWKIDASESKFILEIEICAMTLPSLSLKFCLISLIVLTLSKAFS